MLSVWNESPRPGENCYPDLQPASFSIEPSLIGFQQKQTVSPSLLGGDFRKHHFGLRLSSGQELQDTVHDKSQSHPNWEHRSQSPAPKTPIYHWLKVVSVSTDPKVLPTSSTLAHPWTGKCAPLWVGTKMVYCARQFSWASFWANKGHSFMWGLSAERDPWHNVVCLHQTKENMLTPPQGILKMSSDMEYSKWSFLPRNWKWNTDTHLFCLGSSWDI